MTTVTKECSVCGRQQPLDLFRVYPQSGKHWPYCKECESIEIRRKYLQRKKTEYYCGDRSQGKTVFTENEMRELEDINELYRRHEAAGRRVLGKCKPRVRQVSDLVADMLRRQEEQKERD